jgi:hypothetical protein
MSRWLLLGCLVLAACTKSAPRGTWTDPALDPQELAEGVVIGGVVDLTADRDLFEIQRDSELLAEAFAELRPALPVVPWAEARTIIEVDSLDAVLESYRRTGRLSARQLETLAPLQSGGRFLALVRIDLDTTLWEYTRRVRESGDRTVVDLDPESRRQIGLLFDIYDLEAARLAHTAPLQRTGIEHGSIYTVDGVDNVPTEDEVRQAIEYLDSGSNRPEQADRAGLLSGMFRDAVKYLPKS